jgi:hypothetical protein
MPCDDARRTGGRAARNCKAFQTIVKLADECPKSFGHPIPVRFFAIVRTELLIPLVRAEQVAAISANFYGGRFHSRGFYTRFEISSKNIFLLGGLPNEC